MSGEFLLIYICNFHVLTHLLLIYICKLHWIRPAAQACAHDKTAGRHRCRGHDEQAPRTVCVAAAAAEGFPRDRPLPHHRIAVLHRVNYF
jgi:hypothetical protein